MVKRLFASLLFILLFSSTAFAQVNSNGNIGPGAPAASSSVPAGILNTTGALKGNGAGVITQAACADLSNGGTACPVNIGTSGATIPLLNGANTWSGKQLISSSSFGLSGNISAPAWTTAGIRYANVAATLTDTSSSGTVATVYNDAWGGNTNAASSPTTYTNLYGSYFKNPIAGTNVIATNLYALGADSIFGGVVKATTVNGNTFTTGNYTLTGAAGKTLTFNNNLTLAGTDGVTMTTPTTSFTAARTDAANTFTGIQTYSANLVAALGSAGTPAYGFAGSTSGFFAAGVNAMSMAINGVERFRIDGSNVSTINTFATGASMASPDTYWSRRSAGNWSCGTSDAAAPVACVISNQNVVAGTSNTNGVNHTENGSVSTGSGTSGDIIFNTGGTGAAATVQNAEVNALIIKGATQLVEIPQITTGTNADFACIGSSQQFFIQSTACTISSLRFKKDVRAYNESALNEIAGLKPITFRLKDGASNIDANAASVQIGLSAENVANVDPRLAVYEPDMKTPKSYRQESMIALLIAGMQEQQKEIDALKGQVANDNSTIDRLRAASRITLAGAR